MYQQVIKEIQSSLNMPVSSQLFSCAVKETQKKNKPENQHALRFLTAVFFEKLHHKRCLSVYFLLRQGTLCVTPQSQVAMDTKKKPRHGKNIFS